MQLKCLSKYPYFHKPPLPWKIPGYAPALKECSEWLHQSHAILVTRWVDLILWNAVIALGQLKLFAYSYFDANLPYAEAITWLYHVLSFYYVLEPFDDVI